MRQSGSILVKRDGVPMLKLMRLPPRLFYNWGVAKLVKAPDFDSGIEGSSPSTPATAIIAQLVEPQIVILVVMGSSPIDRPTYYGDVNEK